MARWTKSQEAELANEYARIGYVHGEQWPIPQEPDPMPAGFLALLRSIPDNAGLLGYLAALSLRAHRKR